MRLLAALALPALALALLLAAPAHAQSTDPEERAAEEAAAKLKLEAVRDTMRELAAQRQGTRTEVDTLAQQLAEGELQVAASVRELRTLDAALADGAAELDTLALRAAELEQRLDSQRAVVAALLRSAYALGRHERLRILFAPERVADTARLLAYHQYLQRDRTRRIAELVADLRALAAVRAAIDAARLGLERARQARTLEVATLEAARAQRKETLAALEAQLADQASRLTALGRDEKSLLSLLERLRDAIADIPKVLAGAEPLSTRRGRVPWPVEGRVLQGFGTTAADGRVAEGLLIGARAGADVRAIAHGRVAYADWLKGYGLLAIVDHGDGFMSLYAHNEALLADVGDWVDAGDALATVGASGGRSEPGVYFELRRGGQPLDPSGWLVKRR